MTEPTAIVVALDRSVAPWVAEVKYTFRTLLGIAGFGVRFTWHHPGAVADLQYGGPPEPKVPLHIPTSGWDFRAIPAREASGVEVWRGLPMLRFPGDHWRVDTAPGAWPGDLALMAFWLLTGADEARWPRDRRDNLGADQSVLVRDRLLPSAPVSRWAQALGVQLGAAGRTPLAPPWATSPGRAAFVFTHDVDYPQIIRSIEVVRLLARRGPAGLASAVGVARGTNHFWTFREWVELAARYGTRPTFYFMARRGSLLKYARGLPDDFYDVRRPEFTRLFGELRDAGCEIGLHASYLAHRSAETLRVEAERVAHASGTAVLGNRHHYWHLDPADPNETLRRHELAGLRYDSSLGLEFFPGFRRGTCHPFRPFHPGERRALDTVQLPPAWMDDHFDRRLARNGITDPEAAAREILETARSTGGVAVVDYHSRGMNADFYPRYGPWLARFAEREFDASLAFRTGSELLDEYLAHEWKLASVSSDETAGDDVTLAPAPIPLEVRLATPADLPEVARLHFSLFGDADFNGYSVAAMGMPFLERAFYRLNLDNPALRTLVARADGRVVGFSVYSTRGSGVWGHVLRRHPVAAAVAAVRALGDRTEAWPALFSNFRQLLASSPEFLKGVEGWWIVAGVHPDARQPSFEQRAGARVAKAMFAAMEEDMQRVGCRAWFGVVRPDNAAINSFLRNRGAREAGHGVVQGLEMRYYVKRFASEETRS